MLFHGNGKFVISHYSDKAAMAKLTKVGGQRVFFTFIRNHCAAKSLIVLRQSSPPAIKVV